MIRELQLRHFKAFYRFTVSFGDQAFLVGPNNAGKSTVIAALRTCARMLGVAQQLLVGHLGHVDLMPARPGLAPLPLVQGSGEQEGA